MALQYALRTAEQQRRDVSDDQWPAKITPVLHRKEVQYEDCAGLEYPLHSVQGMLVRRCGCRGHRRSHVDCDCGSGRRCRNRRGGEAQTGDICRVSSPGGAGGQKAVICTCSNGGAEKRAARQALPPGPASAEVAAAARRFLIVTARCRPRLRWFELDRENDNDEHPGRRTQHQHIAPVEAGQWPRGQRRPCRGEPLKKKSIVW
jgi:hypothetical protein